MGLFDVGLVLRSDGGLYDVVLKIDTLEGKSP
jgi:hypothetical protein